MSYQGHRVSIRASAGLAEVDVALSKEDILRNADLALYEAKRRGKGQVAVFNQGFLVQASRRMHLEHALQEALRTQQLEVWFQPIVDAQSHALVGMEALSRWALDGEYISPDEFIGIAEETGLINAAWPACLRPGAGRAEYPACRTPRLVVQRELVGTPVPRQRFGGRAERLPAPPRVYRPARCTWS